MKNTAKLVTTKLMSLNIQLFAEKDLEEQDEQKQENKEDRQNSSDDSKKENKESKKELKYTDDDVNNISKKNSEKATKKLMKDLGIEDIEKAKQILAQARAEEEKNKTPEDKTNDLNNELSIKDNIIQQKNQRLAEAILELRLGANGIKDSNKIDRAKRMIPYESIIDEEGEIDEELIKKEIKSLLNDFPEFKSEKEDSKKGFQFGSDGKENKEKTEQKKPTISQKRWNRFN